MSVRIAPYGTNGGERVKYLNGELFGECFVKALFFVSFYFACLYYLSVLRMLLSVSKHIFIFANNYRSFEKGNLCLLTEFHHLPSSTFSKEKGRVLTGIGGEAFYDCFEELRCDLFKQYSSKRFVEKGWYIQYQRGTSKRLGRKSSVLGRGRERERCGPGERETPPL